MELNVTQPVILATGNYPVQHKPLHMEQSLLIRQKALATEHAYTTKPSSCSKPHPPPDSPNDPEYYGH